MDILLINLLLIAIFYKWKIIITISSSLWTFNSPLQLFLCLQNDSQDLCSPERWWGFADARICSFLLRSNWLNNPLRSLLLLFWCLCTLTWEGYLCLPIRIRPHFRSSFLYSRNTLKFFKNPEYNLKYRVFDESQGCFCQLPDSTDLMFVAEPMWILEICLFMI